MPLEEPTIRPKRHTTRLAAAAMIAGGLLAGPGSAAAVVPGPNGAIVMSKCEDGNGGCAVSHIWTLDPASGAEHPVTTGTSSWDDDPAVSPDGSRVAFQRCPTGGTCRIAVVGIGGGAVTDLTAGTAGEDYPAWSPDGSRLVFSRNDPTGGVHLIVIDANGGNERPLTTGTADDSHATWSPDGSTIAFDRSEQGIGTHIHKISASGDSSAPLTAGTTDYAPSFSPDGSHIVFSAGHAIGVMDSSGGDRHALTAPGADLHDNEPAFAPDGTQIAFERYSQTVPHTAPLLVMGADGSNQHLVSGPSEVLFRADWQPAHPAPASTPDPGSTRPADTSAPGVTLDAPARQSVRRGRLRLIATSDEPATAVARAQVAIPGIARRHRIRPSTTALPANTRTRIRLSIPRKSLRAIRAALARHERLRARIAVSVVDGAGNATGKTLTIRLRK